MFKPKFRYTDKIVGDLTQISAARELVLNSPFIPKWEVSLRREAIIRSAHSSTAIEGNKLSLEQVSDLAQGRNLWGQTPKLRFYNRAAFASDHEKHLERIMVEALEEGLS